jgi:hypothetical protein
VNPKRKISRVLLNRHLALALASAAVVTSLQGAGFADAVVSYVPGSGFADGMDNSASALGAPSVYTVDPDWGNSAITPFNAPYLPGQLVSVGSGGSLTVRFNVPIQNDPAHPYGLDFLIHGSTAFMDSDWPNGRTDASASTFGQNRGQTRVWVSADGAQFFQLNPAFAPVVDGLFPSDGEGQNGLPVNPALTAADFANRTLVQVRELYAGSAGGTGYDLAWALDSEGHSVALPEVSYLRVEVLSGRSEIDAFVAAVPEPATGWLAALGLLAGWIGNRRYQVNRR